MIRFFTPLAYTLLVFVFSSCVSDSFEDSNIEDTNVEDTNVEDTNIDDTNIEDTNIDDTNDDTNIGSDTDAEILDPVCGNNELETGEECDDGNVISNDGCSEICELENDPICGDELCSEGESNATCPADCDPVCGDDYCAAEESLETCLADCEPIVLDGAPIAISSFGGTYPRGTPYEDGILVGFDSSDGENIVLRTTYSDDGGRTWSPRGTVAAHEIAPNRDLGNIMPWTLPSGQILGAFRHHDKPGSDLIYRLLVSTSNDGGYTWSFLSDIETGTIHGIWEPLFFVVPGIGTQVYYAREEINHDQDIVMRQSVDDGASWGPIITVAEQTGSRDGMPAVAQLNDGSLVTIFESFRTPNSGTFVVRTVQSNDNGATWIHRQDLHVPESSTRNAGAPYITALPDGRLLASFMTDENSSETGWANHAAVAVMVTDGIPTFDDLRWAGSPKIVANEPVFWPSVMVTPSNEVLVLYEQGGPKVQRILVR